MAVNPAPPLVHVDPATGIPINDDEYPIQSPDDVQIAAGNNVIFITDDAVKADGASTGKAYVYINNDRSVAHPPKANNFLLGNASPYALTTGTDNFCIGNQSGGKITSGAGNLCMATGGREITTGINNTFIGWDSGAVNTVGNNNTGVAEDALKYVEGDNNTALGYTAGYSISSGNGNVAIAPNSLYNLQTGSENIAIGYAAGLNVAASYNTALGTYSGRGVASTGHSNTALGHSALGHATGGVSSQNVAIGHSSLVAAVSTVSCVGVGVNTLDSVSTGDRHTAVGFQAGAGVTTTNDSISIGCYAGFYETAGAKLHIDSSTDARGSEAGARILGLIHGEINASMASQFLVVNGARVSLAGEGSGGYANVRSVTSLQSAVSGASVTATNLIPAKAFLIGVSTNIVTALGTGGGTTGFTVGDGSDVDRFGVQSVVTLGATTSNASATADPTGWASAARSVVLTAAGGSFNGTGAVRITAHYIDNTPPSV